MSGSRKFTSNLYELSYLICVKTSGRCLENSSDFKHCFRLEVEATEWISDCRAFSILKTVDVKLLQSCSNFTLKPDLKPTVTACLAGRDAQEVLYTGFVHTPSSDSKRLRFLPDICNADIQKTSFSAKTYTVLNGVLNGLQRESWSFGKNYTLSVLTIVYNSPLLSLFASQAGPCLACVADVKRGRGKGNLGAQAWGRKERNACKDAIVFSVFHAQILSVKIVIGQN